MHALLHKYGELLSRTSEKNSVVEEAYIDENGRITLLQFDCM